MTKNYILLLFSLIFMLNYSFAQSNLITADFFDSNSWNITSGELIFSSNTVSTEGNNDMTLAFIDFDAPLASGDILTLSFNSDNVTNFATTGWAGVSLYTGGESGTEQIFIGSLGGQSNWGIAGAAVSTTSFTETSEIVSVDFQYNYDTGNWTLDIGGEVKSGTIASNLAFNTLRIGADIDNLADIAISNFSIMDAVPLPVELVSFDAKVVNSKVLLSWQTASEENNHGFEVQRSVDNSLEWETIGFVLGEGTTSEIQDYEFIDAQPQRGVNYYRLKQVDFDGAFEYSRIITIDNQKIENPVKIYPTIVKGNLTIENGQGTAIVFNLLGQAIQAFNINNEIEYLNLKTLPTGQYLIQITRQDGTAVTKRFLK